MLMGKALVSRVWIQGCTSQPPTPSCSGKMSHEPGGRAGGKRRVSDGEAIGTFQVPWGRQDLSEQSQIPAPSLIYRPPWDSFNDNNYFCYLCAQLLLLCLFATLWIIACQATLSVGVSWQDCWSGLLCPPPPALPDPGIQPFSPASPTLAGRFFTSWATGEAVLLLIFAQINNWLFSWKGFCDSGLKNEYLGHTCLWSDRGKQMSPVLSEGFAELGWHEP